MNTNRPPSKGLGLCLAAVFTLLSGAATFGIWYRSLAPIQSAYLLTYYRAQYLPSLSLFGPAKPKRYAVLTVNGQDANLSSMPATMNGVSLRYTYTTPDQFAAWLKAAVFAGESGMEFLETPLLIWGVLAFFSLLVGMIYTARQKRKLLDGIKLRGPDLMTVDQFNKATKGDGFVLKVKA